MAFQSPRKIPRPVEFDDIASIDKVSDGYGAKVHGVVTSVSPMKGKSTTKFFDGFITDGKKKLRFVGFSPEKAKQIDNFANDQEPVTISNCCIKNAKYGNELEIVVGDYTDISKSTKAFIIDEAGPSSLVESESKSITIDELQKQSAFQKVSIG